MRCLLRIIAESEWVAVAATLDRASAATLDQVQEVSQLQAAAPGLVLAATLGQAALEAVAALDQDAAGPESEARPLAAIGSEARSLLEVSVTLDRAAQEALVNPGQESLEELVNLDREFLGVLAIPGRECLEVWAILDRDERRVWTAHWGRLNNTKSRYELMP